MKMQAGIDAEHGPTSRFFCTVTVVVAGLSQGAQLTAVTLRHLWSVTGDRLLRFYARAYSAPGARAALVSR
jgi:hypothetical protein